MRIRNKLALFIALPAVVFLWFFGWSLYWIGSMKQIAASVERKRQRDLILSMLVLEEQYAK